MLKEDYKNFIPDENGRKYNITQDSQGYQKIQDATNYIQVGDNFGANDINAITYEVNRLTSKFNSSITITIPADDGSNYTTLTDKDGADYYNIQISVSGMTTDFVGTQPLTPKMIDPADTTNFSIADWENIRDNYMPLILGCWGRTGYVDIYLYDKPDIDFNVNLYGV